MTLHIQKQAISPDIQSCRQMNAFKLMACYGHYSLTYSYIT